MPGFCHIELPTTDLEKAKQFYTELFGWEVQPLPVPNYMMIVAGEGAVGGGIQKVDKIVNTPGVHSYVEVSDIEATLKKAETLGGKTIQAKQALPNPEWGAVGILATADGFQLGLWSKA